MRKNKGIIPKYIIIALVFMMGFSACHKNTDWEMMQSQESTALLPTQYISDEVSEPILPDLDFADMTFFEDGYEIVQYESISDGDTAVFVLKDGTFTTRFLAIDTPEVNSAESGMEPWSVAAKEYVESILEGADEIILEREDASDIFDRYDRLLVWVWADGRLLNCMIAEQGLGKVNYIYGDYKYVEYIKEIQEQTKSSGIKIWGEEDPSFDYSTEALQGDIAFIRSQMLGRNVLAEGVVTNVIGTNAFIQDGSGAIYIYTNKVEFPELSPGNKVTVHGKILEYNGLIEISSIAENGIEILEQGIDIQPANITLDMMGESTEGMYVKIDNLTVTSIDYQIGQMGYNIYVSDGKVQGCIRVDKYLKSYPEPEEFSVGDTFSVIGNVGQYQDMYQLMIGSAEDIHR
ncbi:MAG: thermonuclease family protein [Eubacteriales bacterium]